MKLLFGASQILYILESFWQHKMDIKRPFEGIMVTCIDRSDEGSSLGMDCAAFAPHGSAHTGR